METLSGYIPATSGEVRWVKGHADIPENERCDQLAVQASKMPNLQIDYYYEAEQDNNLKLFI